jgi:glycosyltransferase involved in cell wall biosynthesis
VSSADVGVLVLGIEGLQHSRGGVGRYTRNLVADIPDLQAHFRARDVVLTFHFAEPMLSRDGPLLDEELWSRARADVAASGGTVTRLIGDANGRSAWGSWPQFHALSAAGAQLAVQLADRHERLVVLTGTSAFALVPLLLLQQTDPDDGRFALVHTHGAAIPWSRPWPDSAELLADAAVALLARTDARVRIAYVSEFMADVFGRGYGVPAEKLLPNVTGLHRDDPRFAPAAAGEVRRVLERAGVPTDRPLVLAWGRNSAPGLDKGYDLILRACARLDGAVRPVLLTRDPDPGLRQLADQLGVDAVLRHGQPFEVISAVLRWESTVATVFAAEADPGAAGPLEAMRAAADGGGVLVAVNEGSYPAVIRDGNTGLLTERTVDGLAAGLRRALDLGPAERAGLRRRAAGLVAVDHDFSTNVRGLLGAAVAPLLSPAGNAG